MAFLEFRPSTPLFHYCSPEGFYGITKSGSIWLTDLQYLNDPRELQLVAEISNLMLELSESSQTPYGLKIAYKKLVPRLEGVRPDLGLYSFSLSLKGDQLPMWQEYTARGHGFCIAFRSTAFNDMSLRVQKVSYLSSSRANSISDRLEKLIQPLIGLDYKPNQIDYRTGEPISTIIRILCLASSTKDDSWEHEEEVRLVMSCSPSLSRNTSVRNLPIGLLPNGVPVIAENPLYRQRNAQQIPYHVRSFGRWRKDVWDQSGAISQVIVGCNNSSSTDEITKYMMELGYRNFEVTRSKRLFR